MDLEWKSGNLVSECFLNSYSASKQIEPRSISHRSQSVSRLVINNQYPSHSTIRSSQGETIEIPYAFRNHYVMKQEFLKHSS